MKKVIHREFYYQIPEKSGFTLSATEGLSGYIFIDENEFNQSDLYTFLQKILAALNLEIDENIKIITCQQNKVYPIQSLNSNDHKVIISFGIKPEQLQLQGFDLIHHLYHLQGTRILFANSLKNYTDDTSKKILWTQLKQLFNI